MWKCCDIDDNLTFNNSGSDIAETGVWKCCDIDDNLTLAIVAVTLLRQGCGNAVTLMII